MMMMMTTTMMTTRRKTRRTSQRTAAANQIHRGHRTQIRTEMADVIMRRTEQRWAEPRVKGALPLCQPCSPPTTRGSPCIASSTSHSPILCWWSSHWRDPALMSDISFIPSPVWRSSDSKGRWRYAKNSIPLVWWCHEHFSLDKQVQWFKVRVLMSRGELITLQCFIILFW